MFTLRFKASAIRVIDRSNLGSIDFGVVARRASAPRSRRTSRPGTHPGETVEVVAKIVTIADLNRVRITAEGFERAFWLAKVEEIPDSVVPRRIRPEDPGRPIDARVVPVKIALAESTPLKLGQRVEIEILADEHG
jgi:hypothetical protein